MADHIVGMMWNRNEGDILDEIISNALPHVDSLFIADDHSTDNSWDIIKSYAKHPKVEYVRNTRENARDQGQQQALLDEIRRRYQPHNTIVQIIESDIMVLDTDIREAWKEWAVQDIGMTWHLINAARQPGTWDEVDTYPRWDKSIKEIMPWGHWVECMFYTFRPFPGLFYNFDVWSPWPSGFQQYMNGGQLMNYRRGLQAPLLAHYGYRGPTHVLQKYHGKKWRKYPTWDMTNKATIEKTFYYFNGQWNDKNMFKMGRDGWIGFRKG